MQARKLIQFLDHVYSKGKYKVECSTEEVSLATCANKICRPLSSQQPTRVQETLSSYMCSRCAICLPARVPTFRERQETRTHNFVSDVDVNSFVMGSNKWTDHLGIQTTTETISNNVLVLYFDAQQRLTEE